MILSTYLNCYGPAYSGTCNTFGWASQLIIDKWASQLIIEKWALDF